MLVLYSAERWPQSPAAPAEAPGSVPLCVPWIPFLLTLGPPQDSCLLTPVIFTGRVQADLGPLLPSPPQDQRGAQPHLLFHYSGLSGLQGQMTWDDSGCDTSPLPPSEPQVLPPKALSRTNSIPCVEFLIWHCWYIFGVWLSWQL